MVFDIISPVETRMYESMKITYRDRSLAGMPVYLVTEVIHISEGRYFVDEQRSGPYAIWYHRHFIEPEGDGTFMTDIATYRPPFGILGRLANPLIIRQTLRQIFNFLKKTSNSWAKQS